jgi:phosphatidate cytidylyltransferase
MNLDPSQWTVVGSFVLLTLALSLRNPLRLPRPVAIYLPYLWTFFLAFTLMVLGAPGVGVWALAALCFLALREFFTLTDLRFQDRWGVLAAYAAIPFMFYFVQTDWYGMFIISIPVYAFLVIPFLIALGGGEPRGAVFSVGVIVLGLMLMVYCVGHIGYLGVYAPWMAIYVVVAVAVCDFLAFVLRSRDRPPLPSALFQLLAPAPVTLGLAVVLMPWTGIPLSESLVLGGLVPLLVYVGCVTIDYLEADLGIERQRLGPGRGQVLNSLKSFVYTGPVAFHYLRYTLDAF